MSSVQEHENHKIIDSGSAFETVELDDQNNIIQTIKGTGDTWWYRVFKYTYNHFCFKMKTDGLTVSFYKRKIT